MYTQYLLEIMFNLLYWLCVVRLTLKWLIRIEVIALYLHFAAFLAISVVTYVILDRLIMYIFIRCKRNRLETFADIKAKKLIFKRFGKQTGVLEISEIMEANGLQCDQQNDENLGKEHSKKKNKTKKSTKNAKTVVADADGCSGTYTASNLL